MGGVTDSISFSFHICSMFIIIILLLSFFTSFFWFSRVVCLQQILWLLSDHIRFIFAFEMSPCTGYNYILNLILQLKGQFYTSH